eukprot:gene7903-10728_t
MAFPEPFPEDILNEIHAYAGNQKCCDCSSLDTDWASVSHGTLICLDCAGKHRSLGVHVSFVRSIRMDSWSIQQIEMMRQGGNDQIRKFFAKLEIENSPIQILYCTKGANHYRERLKERVDKIMSGEIIPEKRIIKKSVIHNSSGTNKKKSDNNNSLNETNFVAEFDDGPMGMTLTKDGKDRASVSRLVPAGQAQAKDVKIGDFVVGIAGKTMNNYDEIMHMIPCMPRPVKIKFLRVLSSNNNTQKSSISSSISSPDLVQHNNDSIQNNHSKSLTPSTSLHKHLITANSRNDSSPIITTGITASPTVGLDKLVLNHVIINQTATIGIKKKKPKSEHDDNSDDDSDNNNNNNNNNNTQQRSPPATTKVTISSLRKRSKDHTNDNSIGLSIQNNNSHDNNSFRASSASNGDNNINMIEQINAVLNENNDKNDKIKNAFDLNTDDLKASPNHNHSKSYDNNSDNNNSNINANISSEIQAITDNDDEEDGDIEDEDDEDNEEKFVIEVGTIIKVLRKNKWKTAVVRRAHQDGTFKVLFRDGTTESHVPITRMAITNSIIEANKEKKNNKNNDNINNSSDHFNNTNNNNNKSESEKADKAFSDSYNDYKHTMEKALASVANINDDFVVPVSNNKDDYNLEDWIEEDNDKVEVKYKSSSRQKQEILQKQKEFIEQNRTHMSSDYNNIDNNINNIPESLDYVVDFQSSPLGMTLSVGENGHTPTVTKIVANGSAMRKGVSVGDILTRIDDFPVFDYNEAMRILPTIQYPMKLYFKRKACDVVGTAVFISSGDAIIKNTQDIATKLLDTIGLSKSSILQSSTTSSTRYSTKLDANNNAIPSSAAILSSRLLNDTPETDEIDVIINETDLGFRIDERIGFTSVSVVTEVIPNSSAKNQGLQVGHIIIGINREKFISHAHSSTTLKHIKRPVVIRFKKQSK